MPFVDPEEFSGGLWPRGYRAAGARYPRKHSPWDSACGATGRTQMAPVLGSARAPLDLVPELPHEILVRNNGQGGNPHRRNSDSGRFYWAPWKASLYQPGKPLDPKESNGTWNGPRRIGVEESIRLVEPMSGRSGNRGMTADRITNIGILPKGCYFPGPTAARS